MDAELLSGIGGYPVERALGAGGMGRVYLCRDAALDRRVAVKVLLPDLLDQTEMRARFLREARALARVSSPHVVAVHAVGEDAVSGPFVVMEFLDGEDLSDRLKRDKRLPWREVLQIARDAVAGLRAAEQAGIVHRDIKPANLFVVKGVAKLTDFGLAREVQGSASVTQAGIVVGTPAYLAPEVIKGSPANHASDLYSLGATLFHLMSGHPPFQSEAPLEVISQAVRDLPPRLDAENNDVPAAVADLVARMLEKEPALRPQGFAALDEELAALLGAPLSPSVATAAPVAQRTMAFGSGIDVVAAAPSSSPAGDSGAAEAILTTGGLPTMNVPQAPSSSSSGAFAAPPASSPTNPTGESSFPRLRPPSGAPAAVKTATLTVMFTDIAGYTERTSRVSREESARWLALHDQLLQPVFKSFSGKVVKTLGDAFLVTFPSPTDAVHCACAVQDRLWLHNQGALPEDAIQVRAALSAGEVRLHKGDIFGEPVNIASRLEHIAAPGEVIVSDAVYATMNTAEVTLASRGEHTLKGIARPVVVYAAVPDGAPGQPPFSGRALSRVKESAVDVVAAKEKALGVVRGMDKRVLAGAGAGLLLLVLVVALALAGDNRLKRIDRGEARPVLEEIEQTPEAHLSPDDWVLTGHARLALDQRERAFAAYKRAAEKGAVDERMKKAALQALGKKDDDGAKDVLAAWPDKGIEKDLRGLIGVDDWWPRSHALAVLELRKVATDDDRQKVGLHDLESDACGDRKVGVSLLKKAGQGDDVLDALKKLRADPINNACLMFDLGGAEDAVKKRSSK